MPKFGDVYQWRLNDHKVMVINDEPISFIEISPDRRFSDQPYLLLASQSDRSEPWTHEDWELVTEDA